MRIKVTGNSSFVGIKQGKNQYTHINIEKPAEPTKVVSAWAEPIKIFEQPKQSPQPLPQTQAQQQPQVQLSQPLQQQQQQQQSTPGALPKVVSQIFLENTFN